MAPKARARVKVKRHPSGQIVDEARSPSPGQIRRILRKASEAAASPLLGTEIGRLLLNEFLTEAHVAASEKWMVQYSRWCRVSGVPTANAKAQDVSRVHGADNADVPDDIADKWRFEWMATEDFVGRASTEYLKTCVVENRMLATYEAREVMRSALQKLAIRWNMA